jgi:putative salt-induced outer membrane protein YdiY
MLGVLFGSAAHAQAPAEPPALPVPQAATWRYNSQLTGIYTSGAVERTLFTTAQALTWAQGRHFGAPLTGSFSYGRQEARLRERELLVTLAPYYRLDRFRAYALGTYERSNLRDIRYRTQAGAGPGWAFLRDEAAGREMLISNLLLRESTQFGDGTARTVWRSSTRLKLAYRLGALRFGSSTFYQPRLAHAQDVRWANNTSLSVSITQRLALTAAYAYTFEQRVVEQKSRGNTNITVGVSYSSAP